MAQPVRRSKHSTDPRFVYDDQGKLVEVIVPYELYRELLQRLAATADWETLPSALQDAVDNLLADEARAEKGVSKPLRDLLKAGKSA